MDMLTQVYSQLYQLFDDCTPLRGDCGKACGGACCTDEGGEGMLLYPGEGRMLREAGFLMIRPSAMQSGGRCVPIALCQGRCNRRLRPLACRIFPLFPYVKSGSRPVTIMDPRANAICPIARVMKPNQLQPAFVHRVNRAAMLLYQFRDARIFMEEQSELLDEMCSPGEILRKILSE